MVGCYFPPSGCIPRPGYANGAIGYVSITPAKISCGILGSLDQLFCKFEVLIKAVLANVSPLNDYPLVGSRISYAGAHAHRAGIELFDIRMRDCIICKNHFSTGKETGPLL